MYKFFKFYYSKKEVYILIKNKINEIKYKKLIRICLVEIN